MFIQHYVRLFYPFQKYGIMAKFEKLIKIRQWFEVIFYTKPCRPAHLSKDLEENNIVVNMVLIISFFKGLGVVFRMETRSCDISF